ncbi:MAG: hypothetical protein WAT46_04430 [Saprospiraceae bacterium]
MKTEIMSTWKLWAVAVLLIQSLSGCSQEPVQTLITPYDGCCGTEPKILKTGMYNVYIPNIITANGDSINDVFYPMCNVKNNRKFFISNFIIYNERDSAIFVLHALDPETADQRGFWGLANKTPYRPEPALTYKYTGKFKYSFTLGFLHENNKEENIEVEGYGCVIRCDQNAGVLKNKAGCYFPVQGLNGEFNKDIPNKEEKCIK